MRTTKPENNLFTRATRIALVVGVDAAIVVIIALFLTGSETFFQAYLYSYLFWLGITLGLLALLLIHLLVNAKWGLTIRRVTEAGAASIWAMAVLFIPVLFGLKYLYPWTNPETVSASQLLTAKSWYLNLPFFLLRAAIYFAVWIALGYFANRRSAQLTRQAAENPALRRGSQGLGAGGLILYTLTITFASIDWLASLQPLWVSSAFGLIVGMGQLLAGLAFAVLALNLLPSLSLGRRWETKDTPIPYRDLGSYLLTFVMGWAYVAYFQMLIQWAGNLPLEVSYYVARMAGGWNLLAIFIVTFQFALPFAMLLSARVRHNLRVLAGLAGLLLFTNLVYAFWQVKPAFFPGVFTISVQDIFMPLAMGGIWLSAFLYNLKRRPQLTAADEIALLSTQPHQEATS